MGGNDDNKRNDFDRIMDDVGKEFADTRRELERVMDEMRAQLPSPHDAFEDLRKRREGDNASGRGPFERFKGFIDSNFALLSDGFKNFPTNVQELKQRMKEEREARREEELDIWRRWTGSEDSPDHIRMQVERASKADKQSVTAATFMLLRESFERNRHVPAQKILDLYRDDDWGFGSLDQFATPMLSFGGACYYKPETVENLPSTARWGWPAATQRWLSVDWFKRDQYSPLRLEAHPDLAEKGEKWRAAFEDLLLVSLDKPMQTTEKIGQRIPCGKPQSTYHGPGLDWMLSLQCRGILPPQLPNLYRQYQQESGREWFKPAYTRVIPDLDAITSQRSHCMYPRAEADITILMDEVGIQAQPDTDAFSQPEQVRIAQPPWQVPDTEAELYEQMLPQLPPKPATLSSMTGNRDEDFKRLQQATDFADDSRDFETAVQVLRDYENLHGKSNAFLDTILIAMADQEIGQLWDKLATPTDPASRAFERRWAERVDLHERWCDVFARAEEFGLDVEHAHASGAPLNALETKLDEVVDLEYERYTGRQLRTEQALARAEKLGYDFQGWDWSSLPLEELEAELDREEASTSARRRALLAKAARLGYDFEGWEWEGLPVWELEGEVARGEEYARRERQLSPTAAEVAEEAKRPNVLSQLTTTETVRLPDGTVTTKVVLKRRFADGREEVKESVHTGNEVREAEEKAKLDSTEGQRREGKGKGWFWT